MNRYGKRCVLYPRVSTEMQVDGYSLEGQKNMLTRFADREEMIVVDTYEDAGKSGKSIEGRPAFQKMLRDIEDGLDVDYILVYKLSRFGRNAADILNSLELVQSYGVNLICIEEGIDSSQTSGKLLISVLSAVAEIERENIIEQTMNGRREKARQGGWNGGFAPYGYTLEDNKLMIEETEAVAIRKIFELYTSSEIGLGGIANQLNLQGIRKIPRQNGTLEDWTGHFIKLILDNPVYCGKIAYGRRTKEKVKGTKNDYQMKRNDDYILTEGQHKGIVSEEVWEKAHAKRLRTGVKQPSKIGRDRVHLLSGLLKCPVCGSPMYTNKHAWTNKDGTYKEIYYYVCSRNRMVRGKHCEYKAMLKKTDIEPMVIEAIREIVRNEEYAQAIKKRIGVQIDTKAVDKELEGYQAKLKEVDLNKTRLEREIDSLPADAKYRERKLHDMTLRLDSLYDVIVELEEKIEDARLRRDAIKQQAITLENIYKIMVNFDCVYNIINDEEKRNVVTALIKEIEIYRNDESEYPLKRIGLNFPVFKDGGEVTELLWDKGNTVDIVLQDLMDRGIKVAGGDRLGKTILFAQNKRHAEFILERFNKLYPQYRGNFAQRVICDDAYAQTIIDDFKQPEKEPHIAVSVDMMDTGIDVPECVNLVFFKKVRSKAKFWQMIGRGTRLCKGLACVDQIDGTYTDKRRFLIFDYCGNFEYFRQHKEGYETRETKTLSENIFGKQIKIAMALQENTFAGEDYQAWRKEIVNTCHKQVMALNSDLIAVKLRMQYVEKYKKPEAFVSISEGDKGELLTQIAPLVRSDEADEFAKRFDNFMYGLILAHIEQMPAFQYAKKQLCDTASLLERKASIPHIKAKLPMLQEIHTDAFWDANDILLFEQVRKELRELIRFLDEGGVAQRQIVTKLTDPIIDSQEGVQLEAAYDFEDYRAKVNRYVNEHGNTLAIYKLTHNIPLAMGDYQELERVLTSELGSKEDYAREFGDTPFGLLIRKIAKLDHEAAMQAFSAFINDQSLNQKQIAFVNKIINHIELNGYMENVAELTKPPFDKPISFIKLFDAKTRTALMETINQVRENAVQITVS